MPTAIVDMLRLKFPPNCGQDLIVCEAMVLQRADQFPMPKWLFFSCLRTCRPKPRNGTKWFAP